MIKRIPAKARHSADFGWLKTNWLFSFGEYYDPSNLHHGALRVFNDDVILAKEGFPTHPHNEMEIITLVHHGELTHEDSMGHREKLRAGEVQRMTAGTGITHSEYNLDKEDLHLYQLWIIPRQHGLEPSYEQKSFRPEEHLNKLLPVVSGEEGRNGALKMHQDGTIYLAQFEKGHSMTYEPKERRHVFIYITEGVLDINGTSFEKNDQARINGEKALELKAEEDVKFVLVDVV